MQKPEDLFSSSRQQKLPLAERFRPEKLSDFLGQKHILQPGSLLAQAILEDRLFSFIMWGPPGCGKTTLARLIARNSKADFVEFSAVTSGVPEVRKIIAQAKEKLELYNHPTILFVDEIHRFNKAQQDAFLPHVENGSIILIGATIENPYYAVISSLASRLRFYNFRPLDEQESGELIDRVLQDSEKGLGGQDLKMLPEARQFLIDAAGGDGRFILNALELGAQFAKEIEGQKTVTLDVLLDAVQKKARRYDKTGSEHYDTVSAFIKSIRGGDPNGALYWMARMIEGGEDPRFIARRMMIAASEEVGCADPLALLTATAAAQAVEIVGWPEARIILSQAVIHLACSPKSNAAYLAIGKAQEAARQRPDLPVPLHLRNPAFRGAKELGYGEGFLYPHDFPGHFVVQSYLPDALLKQIFYQPTTQGYEHRFYENLKKWWPEKYSGGNRES